eukprot:gene22381-29487_t
MDAACNNDIDDIEDISRDERAELSFPNRGPRVGRKVRPIKPGLATDADAGGACAVLPSDQLGSAMVWVKTFGCSHNVSDGEVMAGLLQDYGYRLVDDINNDQAAAWVINTCTVKGPSESAMSSLIRKGKLTGKRLIIAGCVPQGDKKHRELQDLSLIGVTQIDRVVEVVEEALKGNTVQLLTKKALPALDLPKVRRNRYVEIVPLSTGCLGACTYCKTKHARGHLGSYDLQLLASRVASVAKDPEVREIWLSSEDTGAYGRDIGSSLPDLLKAMVAELPADGRVMLRVGMTNPPYILEHLEAIAEILQHPCVFTYLHVPVQSEFEQVVDTLTELVPGMQFATDIICGFPGESEDDHKDTLSLLAKHRFPHTHISQFYPRGPTGSTAGVTHTRAAGHHSNGSAGGGHKRRTRQAGAHTKGYTQVLLMPEPGLLGSVVEVLIDSSARWSVTGKVVSWVYRCPQGAWSGEWVLVGAKAWV